MAQSLARLWTHLIFSTKNRFPFFTDKILRAETHAYLAQSLRNHGCETLIVKLPSAEVDTELVVPFSDTVAPESPISFLSITRPLTVKA